MEDITAHWRVFEDVIVAILGPCDVVVLLRRILLLHSGKHRCFIREYVSSPIIREDIVAHLGRV